MTDIIGKAESLKERVNAIIETLPVEVQEALRLYLSTISSLTDAELQDALDKWLAGDVEATYMRLVKGLTTEDLSAEMDRIIADLKAMNKDNYTYVDIQKALILKAFMAVIQLAKAVTLAVIA